MIVTRILLTFFFIYLCIGFVFAIAFVSKGIEKIDQTSRGSSWGFRLIILPGVIAFWPVLLKKWMNINKPGPKTGGNE